MEKRDGLEIRLLGPVEIVGGRTGAVSLPELPRRLLTALALHAGETMSADALIDALWGESPPASATKLLQVHVSRLRKALDDTDVVRTRPSGYALGVEVSAVDTRRFEQLLEAGRHALNAGNAALAAARLARGLGLWRGQALGEFALAEFARSEADRLEELRLVAFEERFEADLRRGRHREVLPELQAFALAQPLRERPQMQLMLALYRGGRQVDALDHFATVRARLAEELGLEPGVELRALQRRILQHDPTLTVEPDSSASFANVPAAPNALLGREGELAELADLLGSDARLVVVTGPGGVGKTRLAQEAARRVSPGFANGAVYVELAPVLEAHLVPSAISRSLGLEDRPGRDGLGVLEEALRDQELLLVLDNAEHLPDAFVDFSRLLARCPDVTLLVTSRAVLHLSGEHVFPVPTLDADDAADLFVRRARERDRHFAADAANPAIGAICARLDGLPLAIELAAAQTTTLDPERLLEALDARLPLLTGGPRDAPARQQTLRATVEWSFQRLTAEQNALAGRLAVFVSSFDLDAALGICGADRESLDALVGQSLLTRIGDGRFAYLETIRELALELLAASADEPEVRRRHLRHALEVAEGADLSAVRRRSGERLDVAAAEQDNFRAALTWATEHGAVEPGLELVCALERFWVTHDPAEGMRRVAALLERPEAATVPAQLRAHALRVYGSTADIAGHDALAEEMYSESLAVFEQLGDEDGQAALLHRLAISALRRGDLEVARTLVERSHAAHERSGNRWGQAQTIGTLGAISRDSGDLEEAYSLIEESARMANEAGVVWWESGMLAELAHLLLEAGRIDDGELKARRSLELAHRIGDTSGRIFGVGLLARAAAERGDAERAVSLWSAVRHQDGVAPLGGWRRHRPAYAARMTTLLAHSDELGSRPLDQAVEIALAQPAE